jgi:hypothetical protein
MMSGTVGSILLVLAGASWFALAVAVIIVLLKQQ